MKKIYTLLLAVLITTAMMAQEPTKKWKGTTSDEWDLVTSNWVPLSGLPIPGSFETDLDVLIDDSRTTDADTLKVVGEISVANLTINNSTDFSYAIIPSTGATTDSILGSGAIYKEGNGEVIISVPTKLAGGVIVREGYYSADNSTNAVNVFGEKVTLEGGGVKVHYQAVDNPTFSGFNTNFDIPNGKTGEIFFPRRVNVEGTYTGSGTLNMRSNGERVIVDFVAGADFSAFEGTLNVLNLNDTKSYTPGFTGVIFKAADEYTIEIDAEGTVTETGVTTMLSKSKLNVGSEAAISTSASGFKCYEIGELTGDATSTMLGYYKKSTSPYVLYRVGGLNTNFTYNGRFTGEMDKGDNYRRYNLVGLQKVGTGTMTLTNSKNYLTGGIFVLDGTLLVNNNPNIEGTGTGWFSLGKSLFVGKQGVLGGTGSISRNIEVYGKLAPGSNSYPTIGTLTVKDSINAITVEPFTVEMKPSGTLEIELTSATSYDVIKADSINSNGTLKVILTTTHNLQAGDAFKIIDAIPSTKSVGFTSIEVPTEDGLVWDTSTLETDGTIRLTSNLQVLFCFQLQ